MKEINGVTSAKPHGNGSLMTVSNIDGITPRNRRLTAQEQFSQSWKHSCVSELKFLTANFLVFLNTMESPKMNGTEILEFPLLERFVETKKNRKSCRIPFVIFSDCTLLVLIFGCCIC